MAFVCLEGGLIRFSVPGATEKIAGLWFIRGVSVPRLRCTTREGGGRSLLLFFENQKKCTDFFKEGPNCVHPWV